MNFEKFLNIIWKQPAAGQDGFEGLVAKLLERLTGQRFHLSRSGRQEGRDMASNSLMAECKRYDDATNLKSDELLAKFAAAALNSLKPDLWMVVTTKRLGDQHHNQLRQFSKEHGIVYFSIDAQGEEDSFLTALCTYAPDITVSHLQKKFADQQKADDFSRYLQALKENPEIAAKTENLKQELSRQNIGYDHWRDTQNAWLCKRLRNQDESRADFSQNIAVRADGELLIPRTAAQEALDNWFANWHEQHKFFVVLGEEGDGKTWAVADWLYDKLSDGFPVIFLPSGMADCKEPDIHILLSEIITNQLRQPYDGYWQKRLQRWLERPAGDTPLFLLVMDGLNERPDMEWRQLLAKFAVEPWCNRAAVLMTCRNHFWREKLEAVVERVTHFQLLPYNDAELNQAIAASGMNLAEFHGNIIDMLRVPRYFDLAVRLRKNIGSKGDVTRERLIYEDWRDRIGRKFDNSLMDDKEFQDMIRDLSRSAMKRESLSRRDVADELSPYGEHYRLMKQLEGEGIIKWDNGSCEINSKHLTLGLGLLLAKEAFDAAKFGKDIAAETIARCQEPQPDMDLKVSICAMALYHALGEKEWPEEIHLALFNAWVFGRNIKEDDWWRITSYLPVRPEIYLRMMEQEWSGNADNMGLQDVFKKRFLQFGAQDNVKQALVPAFERWMGFVHSAGYGSLFNDEKSLEEGRKHVQEALGDNFSGEFFRCKLTIVEDENLLWLSKVALTIISNQPRALHIRAIVTSVVAGTVMGYPYFADDLSWVLRTAKDDIEGIFLQEAEKLLNRPEPVAQKAAWWLLDSLGTEKAWQLRDAISYENRPKPFCNKEDICTSRLFVLSKKNYLDCIENICEQPNLAASKLRDVALNPACGVPDNIFPFFTNTFRDISLDKIRSAPDGGNNHEDWQLSNVEPALCAYCPERFAEIINELARQLPERSGIARRSLSWLIYEHILILDETSREAVDHAWRSSLANAEDENSRIAEKVLFPCVLRGRTLEQQLDFIEERGGKYSAPFLQKIDNPAKAALLTEKLKNISSAEQLHNFLSVVASSVEIELDDQTMSLMPDFSKIDDNMLRADILEIIFRSKNQKAIHSFLNCDWSSENAARDDERHWGSYLLAEYGRELPFSEISRRVSVDILGYAVKKRGCKPEEVSAYGEILNWRLPDSYVQTDVLAEVIELYPEYIVKWLKDASRLIWTQQFFCKSLCRVLLDKQPEQGRQLFWKFRRNNRQKTQTDSLFNANDSTEVFDLRKNLLNNVLTDNDLFEIVFFAQKHDKHEWLEETINAYLESDFSLDNAKALFLLGFMDDHSYSERLDAWIAEKQSSWRHDCARKAKIIHERNQWAHHWFERFVNHEETLQAWAAFRLFLRCVDRRFWLWGEEMIDSPEVPYERFEHYRACRESIVKAIKENEEKSPFELKKHLVGWKVQENQLWPWLGRSFQLSILKQV